MIVRALEDQNVLRKRIAELEALLGGTTTPIGSLTSVDSPHTHAHGLSNRQSDPH